jgi:thiaminase/transcriptional activator TenA
VVGVSRAPESDAASDDRRFTDRLRERSGVDWERATEHRFVREFGSGAIDDEVVRRYLVQDYAFVRDLTRLIGHAAANAPTVEDRVALAEFLAVVGTDEDDYFERAFDALDVPASDRTGPELAPATRAFRDLLGRARARGYPEALAVLVAAEWVYLDWASGIDDPPEPFYLGEWIELHATPAFESTVEGLRDQLDTVGPTLSPRRRDRVVDLFERTVELEVAFFDAAYDD